ncbi:hypothetical protein K4A83_19395 [Spirulina subsalsa FACHB-351]|uniref:Uncharacterized protein n=1 Tax=Spirulina subsalsa FACHB-351 TaxID=234711 RepID=A0ABT3LA86_9CYAN|nr:hypothetical protein [Spirulina subsalsa]MCW6038421.1 hypothetical protein [Spirulina subsalsa FACHB-351]
MVGSITAEFNRHFCPFSTIRRFWVVGCNDLLYLDRLSLLPILRSPLAFCKRSLRSGIASLH